jgi:hypothetical protein
VQIGEQDLPSTQRGDFVRLRLLDLDDQFGGGEHLRGARQDACADSLIGCVVKANATPCLRLDDHLMAVMYELADTAGRQADAVLVRLHLLRDTDQHAKTPLEPRLATAAALPQRASIRLVLGAEFRHHLIRER